MTTALIAAGALFATAIGLGVLRHLEARRRHAVKARLAQIDTTAGQARSQQRLRVEGLR